MPRPQSIRTTRRDLDLQVIQQAAARIAEINAGLDDVSAAEGSDAARMRELREATNQIVRLANDAIQAYRRAAYATKVDIAEGRGDPEELERTRVRIRDARATLLSELGRASHRYPWAEPWPEP